MKVHHSFISYIVFVLCLIPGQVCASWDGNGILSMVEAYNLALEHEAAHGAARQRFRAEQELLPQARSRLLPRITLEASRTMADYQNPSESLEPTVMSDTVGAYLTQPVYQRDLWHLYNKAAVQVRTAELRLEADRQRLAMETAEIYLNIIRLSREMALSRIELEAYRVRWKQADALLDMGLVSRADMLEAKARIDETEALMLITSRNRLQSIRDLQRRIGVAVNPESMPLLSEDYQPGEMHDEEWLERVAESNLAVGIARLEKEVAGHETEARRSGHYPRLTLRSSISDRYNDDKGVTQGKDSRISLELQVPLFTGGHTMSAVSQAKSLESQAEEALRNALETGRLEVRKTLDNLESGKANIASWRTVLDARAKTLEAAEVARRVGLKNMVDVLDAQASLNRIRRELNNSIHDHLLYKVRLNAVVGIMTSKTLEKMDSVFQH